MEATKEVKKEINYENITEVKAQMNFLVDKKNSLKQQKTDSDNQLSNIRNEFKTWLNENFKESEHYGGSVQIKDAKNVYNYNIKEEVLRMSKEPRRSMRGMRGFGFHPMDIYFEQYDKMMREETETFYEGNKVPQLPKELDLYETLKNDILNNGEISTRIKKYIGEDRLLRIKLEDDIKKLSNDIYQAETEINNLSYKHIKAVFTAEKIKSLFNEKATIVTGNDYTLKNGIKSIHFKKETKNQYYIEIVNKKDEPIIEKYNKSNFFNIIHNFCDF